MSRPEGFSYAKLPNYAYQQIGTISLQYTNIPVQQGFLPVSNDDAAEPDDTAGTEPQASDVTNGGVKNENGRLI